MPAIVDLLDPPRFAASVAAKLSRHAGERAIFAPAPRGPQRPLEQSPARSADATYTTTPFWRALLEPKSSLEALAALAAERLSEGRWIDAQATLAAAHFLGAPRRPDALTFAGDDPRPERARTQPSTRFRGHPWRQRHWLAWDARNYGLVELPTLLAESADESFLVRTRVYRSLGQLGHAAALPALRAGLEDPHPFARAQAARSLGWLGDPGSVTTLLHLAKRDAEREVQRSARVALARVVVLWEHWGEWPALLASQARVLELARKLRLMGAFGDVRLPVREAPSCGPELKRDQGFAYHYAEWFAHAQAEEDLLAAECAQRAPLETRFAEARERKDWVALVRLAGATSRCERFELRPELEGLSAHPHPTVRFHAARALRLLRARAG